MPDPDVLILGGGFGGLTVANELLNLLSDNVKVTLVDREDFFSLGLSKLWVLAGYRDADLGKSRSLLVRKGVNFVKDEVLSVDVERREVKTNSQVLGYDYLIVALGCEPWPSLIPGFSGIGFNLYDREEVKLLRDKVREHDKGRIVFLIGVPYKCPPAPYEAALMVDDLLRERRVRGSVEMEIHTPQAIAMPVAGKKVSDRVGQALSEKGIDLFVNSQAVYVDAASKLVHFKDGLKRPFDILVGVPPHRPPSVVQHSVLVDDSGWIPVNPLTLETRFHHVYAIGDVTTVRLPSGQMLPKAGIFAELEGKVVSENIASEIRGSTSEARFDGTGYCFVELAPRRAAYLLGNFFKEPAPSVSLDEPSEETFKKKEEFESERLRKWF